MRHLQARNIQRLINPLCGDTNLALHPPHIPLSARLSQLDLRFDVKFHMTNAMPSDRLPLFRCFQCRIPRRQFLQHGVYHPNDLGLPLPFSVPNSRIFQVELKFDLKSVNATSPSVRRPATLFDLFKPLSIPITTQLQTNILHSDLGSHFSHLDALNQILHLRSYFPPPQLLGVLRTPFATSLRVVFNSQHLAAFIEIPRYSFPQLSCKFYDSDLKLRRIRSTSAETSPILRPIQHRNLDSFCFRFESFQPDVQYVRPHSFNPPTPILLQEVYQAIPPPSDNIDLGTLSSPSSTSVVPAETCLVNKPVSIVFNNNLNLEAYSMQESSQRKSTSHCTLSAPEPQGRLLRMFSFISSVDTDKRLVSDLGYLAKTAESFPCPNNLHYSSPSPYGIRATTSLRISLLRFFRLHNAAQMHRVPVIPGSRSQLIPIRNPSNPHPQSSPPIPTANPRSQTHTQSSLVPPNRSMDASANQIKPRQDANERHPRS
ncbi:hypothetical protein C8R43DRAFT_1236376 [Mycena crocata]|nr:hypothetical protein C8R43DRAFT_1236376 [Mycena crocata]